MHGCPRGHGSSPLRTRPGQRAPTGAQTHPPEVVFLVRGRLHSSGNTRTETDSFRCEPKARFWASGRRPIPSSAANDGPASGANREALLAFTLRPLAPLGHFDPGPLSRGSSACPPPLFSDPGNAAYKEFCLRNGFFCALYATALGLKRRALRV